LRYVTATDKQISVKGSSFKAKRGWKRRSRNHSTITDISIKILNNCSLSFAKLNWSKVRNRWFNFRLNFPIFCAKTLFLLKDLD